MNKISIIILTVVAMIASNSSFAQHNAGNKGKILMIASNPSVNKKTAGQLEHGIMR